MAELRAAVDRGRQIEVLILDFGQQNAEASQLVTSIRNAAEFAELPIVLLMGIGADISPAQLDAWQPVITLRKPVRMAQLLEAVQVLKSDGCTAVAQPFVDEVAMEVG